MDTLSYHKILENPRLLDAGTLPELEQLMLAYPYSENVRVLYALNLLKLNDFKYQKNLTKAAFYASSRKKLKYWVDIMQGGEDLEEAIVDDDDNLLVTNDEELQPDLPPVLEEVNTEDFIIDASEEVEEEKDEVEDSSNIVGAEEEKEEHHIEEDPQEKELQRKVVRTKTELLKLVKKRLAEIKESGESEKEKQKASVDKDKKASNNSLIDDFIKNQPSISRPDKEEFFDPQKGAIDSTTYEDDFFVTETLAGIYADQSKHKKAIEIYRKLILKFPKKSSYFATRIQDLSKK